MCVCSVGKYDKNQLNEELKRGKDDWKMKETVLFVLLISPRDTILRVSCRRRVLSLRERRRLYFSIFPAKSWGSSRDHTTPPPLSALPKGIRSSAIRIYLYTAPQKNETFAFNSLLGLTQCNCSVHPSYSVATSGDYM